MPARRALAGESHGQAATHRDHGARSLEGRRVLHAGVRAEEGRRDGLGKRRKRSPCMMRRILPLLCMGSFWIAGLAQDFPIRPVRIVVPWPPSGNVDIT